MTSPIPFPSPLRARRLPQPGQGGTSATSVVSSHLGFSYLLLPTSHSPALSAVEGSLATVPITPLFPPHRRYHPITIVLSMTSNSGGMGYPRLLLTKHPIRMFVLSDQRESKGLFSHSTRVFVLLAPALAGSDQRESKGLSLHPIRTLILSAPATSPGALAPSCWLPAVGSPSLNYLSPIALAPSQCHNRAYDPSPGSFTGRKHFRSLRCLILRADKGWDFASPGKPNRSKPVRLCPQLRRRWKKGRPCPIGPAPSLGAEMKPNSSPSCKPARKRLSTGWSRITTARSTT